jgi:hypothetical protein
MRTVRYPSPLPPGPVLEYAGSPLPPGSVLEYAGSPLPPGSVLEYAGSPLPPDPVTRHAGGSLVTAPGAPGQNGASGSSPEAGLRPRFRPGSHATLAEQGRGVPPRTQRHAVAPGHRARPVPAGKEGSDASPAAATPGARS